MRTIADPAVQAEIRRRIAGLTPTTARVWGTMTPHQMLNHVAGGMEAAANQRPFELPIQRPNRLMKWFALRAPLRWPRGIKAGRPGEVALDPAAFESERARYDRALVALVGAPTEQLAPAHPLFGPMTASDWYRWAWLHADHHLRQFGL